MTETGRAVDATATAARRGEPATSPDETQGWYLYGITRSGAFSEARLREIEGMSAGGPVHAQEFGAVAAVGQYVWLSEFGTESLRARLEDAQWLESVVRRHNDVISALHQQRAILPSKFGSVYASPVSLCAELESLQSALNALLDRVSDCDEWAVRLFIDRDALREHVRVTHQGIAPMQQDLAGASPGRAYLLRRKLDEQLDRASEQAAGALAAEAYAQLARHAAAAQPSPLSHRARDAADEVEALRAAFLVPRAATAAFVEATRACAAGSQMVRSECSGPWPPYSFATFVEEPSV